MALEVNEVVQMFGEVPDQCVTGNQVKQILGKVSHVKDETRLVGVGIVWSLGKTDTTY